MKSNKETRKKFLQRMSHFGDHVQKNHPILATHIDQYKVQQALRASTCSWLRWFHQGKIFTTNVGRIHTTLTTMNPIGNSVNMCHDMQHLLNNTATHSTGKDNLVVTDDQDNIVVGHIQNMTANTSVLDQTTDSVVKPMYANTGIPVSVWTIWFQCSGLYTVCSSEWIQFCCFALNLSENLLKHCY